MGIYTVIYYGVQLEPDFTVTDKLKINLLDKGYEYFRIDRVIKVPSTYKDSGFWDIRETEKENRITVYSGQQTFEVPMEIIEEFKEFLRKNDIKSQPKWMADVSSTLDM